MVIKAQALTDFVVEAAKALLLIVEVNSVTKLIKSLVVEG